MHFSSAFRRCILSSQRFLVCMLLRRLSMCSHTVGFVCMVTSIWVSEGGICWVSYISQFGKRVVREVLWTTLPCSPRLTMVLLTKGMHHAIFDVCFFTCIGLKCVLFWNCCRLSVMKLDSRLQFLLARKWSVFGLCCRIKTVFSFVAFLPRKLSKDVPTSIISVIRYTYQNGTKQHSGNVSINVACSTESEANTFLFFLFSPFKGAGGKWIGEYALDSSSLSYERLCYCLRKENGVAYYRESRGSSGS